MDGGGLSMFTMVRLRGVNERGDYAHSARKSYGTGRRPPPFRSSVPGGNNVVRGVPGRRGRGSNFGVLIYVLVVGTFRVGHGVTTGTRHTTRRGRHTMGQGFKVFGGDGHRDRRVTRT